MPQTARHKSQKFSLHPSVDWTSAVRESEGGRSLKAGGTVCCSLLLLWAAGNPQCPWLVFPSLPLSSGGVFPKYGFTV